MAGRVLFRRGAGQVGYGWRRGSEGVCVGSGERDERRQLLQSVLWPP